MVVAIVAGALMLLTYLGSNVIARISGEEGANHRCGNGFDDDGDDRIDYPNDSGCASKSDTTEYDPSVSPPPTPPPPPPPPGTKSWNRYVRRTPVVTTIPFIVGNQMGFCGGATEARGGFPNHLVEDRTRPPVYGGTGGYTHGGLGQPTPNEIPESIAFVQVNGLRMLSTNRKPFAAGIPGDDGDATTNAIDPNRSEITNANMKTIHLEISRAWGTLQRSDGSIQGPFLDPYPAQTVWPAPGTLVDVQGFVRWDTLHTNEAGHSCSGWEIHPVSAWRLHR